VFKFILELAVALPSTPLPAFNVAIIYSPLF
jgi:hypothetical protein